MSHLVQTELLEARVLQYGIPGTNRRRFIQFGCCRRQIRVNPGYLKNRLCELIPRAAPFIRHVIETVIGGWQNARNLMSQIHGISRSDHLIVYDANRFVALRSGDHRPDEVTAFSLTTGDTVKPAGTNKKVLFGSRPDQKFAGKLGGRVDTQRRRLATFRVRFTAVAVKDIVRADVNKNGIQIVGYAYKVQDSEGIHLKS